METIKSSTEISCVFAQGKHLGGSAISLLVYKNPMLHEASSRVAFIAGKKHGGAVWRNQAKRRLRAIAQDMKITKPGLDVIFVANRSTTKENYSRVLLQAQSLLETYFKECNL